MSTRRSDALQHLYHRSSVRAALLVAAAVALLLFSLLSISIGAADLTFGEVWSIVFTGYKKNIPSGISLGKYSVIWDIRLPRICMALLCGSALSTGGTAMQGILRNPLASPYTLGISAASAFGASLAIITNHTNLIIPSAFLTSLTAISAVLIFAKLKGVSPESLILSGIAIMYAFSAGTSLLQYLATYDQLAKIVFWLMGSLSSTTWRQVGITAIACFVLIPLIYSFSWKLNIMKSGHDTATSLGVNPSFTTVILIATVTLLSSLVVSYSGIIGFIGLAAPHISRLLIGSDHRVLFPTASITGAFLLLISDTLARTLLGNTELPIGIITSLIGVPFLVSILMNKQKNRERL